MPSSCSAGEGPSKKTSRTAATRFCEVRTKRCTPTSLTRSPAGTGRLLEKYKVTSSHNGVLVAVGVSEGVRVGVLLAVEVSVGVRVGVLLGVEVLDGVREGVRVGVRVGVPVGVNVFVADGVLLGVWVGVFVCDGSGISA